MSWTPQQLDQLRAEAAHKQAMRDAGVDPADPVAREAWEAEHGAPPSDAWADPSPYGTETSYGRHLRMGFEVDKLELAEHACPLTACVYCHVVGLVEHFELVNNGASYACRQQSLCQARQLAAEADPVPLVLQLVRELAQVARDDRAALRHLGAPGSPQQLAHAQQARPKRMLSGQELARLHLVLRAAGDWLADSCRADWGQQLDRARADLGCKRCGAMGPREPCTTAQGTERREWHAGRRF